MIPEFPSWGEDVIPLDKHMNLPEIIILDSVGIKEFEWFSKVPLK